MYVLKLFTRLLKKIIQMEQDKLFKTSGLTF